MKNFAIRSIGELTADVVFGYDVGATSSFTVAAFIDRPNAHARELVVEHWPIYGGEVILRYRRQDHGGRFFLVGDDDHA